MDPEQRLRSFLDKFLKQQRYKDHRIELKENSTGGANYTSQGFSCVIVALGKPDVRLFAKIAIFSEELRSLTGFNVYETEILFYAELVPRYKELEDTYNIVDDERLLVPKYYGGSRDYMKEVLLLENLAMDGYEDFDRFACFDWDYAAKCVEQLAKLHSLAIAHEINNPEEFEKVAKKFKVGYPAQYLKNYLDCSSASSLSVCHEENKNKLKNFINEMVNKETFIKFSKFRTRPGLIHGDFRPSNIMHKVSKDGNLQVAILDHQLMQRGNPAIDLMYFVVCGSNAMFRAKYFHRLMDHYYYTLSRALHRLCIQAEKVYPKEVFDTDVKLFLPYGLMLAVILLPLVTVDVSKSPGVSDFIGGQNFTKEPNPNLTQRLNDVVNDFIEMGVL